MNKRAMPAGRQGFTLLELLVAAGVIAVLTVIITQVLFSSIHLNTKTEVIKELKQSGEMTLGIISRMIQNATAITCDINGTSITITGQDGGSTTLECRDDAGISRIASNSADITNDSVTLIDGSGRSGCDYAPLLFTCVETGGVTDSITVRFSLRQKNLAATSYEAANEEFQTTVSIRNAIEQ